MKETVDLRHGVNVIFKCDCGKVAEGKTTLERGFRSIFTRQPWGIGRVVDLNTIDDITPDGWWVFDPYTHLCYCPQCRAEIEAKTGDRCPACGGTGKGDPPNPELGCTNRFCKDGVVQAELVR